MNDFNHQPSQPPAQPEGLAERLGDDPRYTALSKLEQTLLDSESRYRALIDSTAAGYVVIEPRGRVLDANEIYARLTGHQAVSHILGRSILEWTAKHDVTRTVEEVRRCLTEGSARHLELDYVDRQGRLTPVILDATVCSTADGPCIVALCRDLRDRLDANNNLHISRQRLLEQQDALAQLLTSPAFLEQDFNKLFALITRTVAELLRIERVNIWRLNDAQTRLVCVNGFERSGNQHVAGMELDAESYRSYFRALENNQPMLVDDITLDARTSQLSENHLPPFGVTGIMDVPIFLNSRLDGVLCLEQVGFPEPWRPEDRLFAASVANLIALAVQQQERLRAEESLRHSEDRYRQLVDLSPDAILVVQHDRITFANPAALLMLGASDTSQVLGEGIFRFIHPLYHDTARNRLRLTSELRATIPFVEEKYVRLDGSTLEVETTSGPYHDEQGEGIQVIVRDISARKHTEQQLANSEQRLELALRAAELGLWDWNLQTGEAYFDDRWLNMVGYSREEFAPDINAWERIVHADDLPHVISATRAHAQGQTPYYESEHRVRTKSGEWRWIHDKGKIVEQDNHGRPLREIGTSLDVTMRKQHEEALRASEEKFARFFRSNPLPGIIATFPESRVIELNEAFLRTTGYARDDVIGRAATESVLPMDVVQRSMLYQMLDSGHTPYAFEGRFRVSSGELRDVLATYELIEFGGERCFVGMYYDITDRKLVEADVRRLNEELEQRVIERTAELETSNATLRAVEARQRALLNAIPDSMFRISSNGTVLDFSAPRGDEVIDPERLIGYNLRDLGLDPVTLLAMLATIERALTGATVETLEYTLTTPKGQRIYEARALSSGTAEVVAMVRDITERMRIEGALRVSEANLTAAQSIAHLGSWEQDVVNLDDLSANPLRWSDEMYRILGYLPGEVPAASESFLNTVHPDERLRVRDAWIAALRNGEHFDMELRIIQPNGAERILHMKSDIVYDDRAGGLLKLLGVVQDITERKLAEEARRMSEQRLRQIIDAVPHLIYAKDVGGRFILVNQAVADVHGTTVDNMLGKTEADFQRIPVEVARSRETDLEVVLVGQAKFIPEETITDVFGNTRVLETVKIPFTFSGTTLPAVLGVSTEVTYRKEADNEIRLLNEQLEARVQQRTAELEAANRELESFSYSVSHDLIAPLRGIDGWSLALLEDYRDRLDERGREYLLNVRAEAQRMARLIDDMLELSRVTRAQMRREPVDMSAVAAEIAASLRQRQPERSVEFIIEPNLVVAGDPTLLRVALQNLLENAWKFTGRNEHSRIELGVTMEDRQQVFFVRDNGAGFDMAYADKLFVPFARLHRATEFPGSGVGLASVQRIVQRHGGHIWANAAVAQGAMFKFTLPARE